MKKFKYLLFDRGAISTYVSKTVLQSIEYSQGKRLVQHCRGELVSEVFEDTAIGYFDEGVIFLGKPDQNTNTERNDVGPVFCFDLTQCKILDEQSDSVILTVLQKSYRTALKIWNRQPFSSSERTHGSKSILFPFVYPDARRLVIERSINVLQMEKRGIKFPLLAYKYNAEEPSDFEDIVDSHVLKVAGKTYSSNRIELQRKLTETVFSPTVKSDTTMHHVKTTMVVGRDDFIFWSYEKQYDNLTDTQREVVDSENIKSPLRVDGAAGTGKTLSLLMRAYRLLKSFKEKQMPYRIVFFAHSQSTCRRNLQIFSLYEDGNTFLNYDSLQSISFVTLLDFCADFTKISLDTLLDRDAGDAKSYQLMIIESVVEKAIQDNIVRTYWPALSDGMQEVLDQKKTATRTLCAMLQHEFSIQIKGRTDCLIEAYYELSPIPNGLPCKTRTDKEFVFSLFQDYQRQLQSMGSFDVDDVTLEALSHLNAPVWRRDRAQRGYDYIIVDEMHLFNMNEQSIFLYLTKDMLQKDIPICFALDYSQTIGDRGDVNNGRLNTKFVPTSGNTKEYQTVFRNSPDIVQFCASIVASGTLMFMRDFFDPYKDMQSNFTKNDEQKSKRPILSLYKNDNEMIASLPSHIQQVKVDLHCSPHDIAVITFEESLLTEEGFQRLCRLTESKFTRLFSDRGDLLDLSKEKNVILASPYAVNGLEFKAVILLGVDEGRVPQTMGTSDISQHYIKYSAYNLLYLTSSRAKYRLILLGNKLRGRSSCLEHSIQGKYLDVE